MSEALGRRPIDASDLDAVVTDVVERTPIFDIHTHLFAPAFGSLGLWGIDELLTYHYLEAELFRAVRIDPDAYWALDKPARADLIWRALFVDRAPLSESTRGVVAVLQALGLETGVTSLAPLRAFFSAQSIEDHLPRVMRLAGLSDVVMTNDPLDPDEAPIWLRGVASNPGIHAALRIDRLINDWPGHWRALTATGYDVSADAGGASMSEVRRFLTDWVTRMQPLYMAVSLPDTFAYPADDLRTALVRGAVLPACQELGVPMALMIGVRRQVNPALRLAGDASGVSDLRSLGNLCHQFPGVRFLVTLLSRENQHELCVYARKFANLMPFGCWWFLNNPSLVEEITRMRLEMLGTTFIPQHSDARVLEQVIYKWRNSRRTIAPVLARSYRLLVDDGRAVSREDIENDVTRLFRTNFTEFAGGTRR
jgi:hypothetical protein